MNAATLTCSTTVTVPGAIVTTDATVASWFSEPSSIICWRMLTDVGSSLSPAVADTTPKHTRDKSSDRNFTERAS